MKRYIELDGKKYFIGTYNANDLLNVRKAIDGCLLRGSFTEDDIDEFTRDLLKIVVKMKMKMKHIRNKRNERIEEVIEES